MPFATTKTTVECYKIRSTDGSPAWADITIDANGRGGRISISSDYGNWSNYWDAAGPDFKQFLGKINQHYAAGKFGAEEWINVESTLQAWRDYVKEARKDGAIDKQAKALILKDIKELAHENHSTLPMAVQSTEHLVSFLYTHAGYPEFRHEANPHFARFWEELWPVLLAEFKREAEPVTAG